MPDFSTTNHKFQCVIPEYLPKSKRFGGIIMSQLTTEFTSRAVLVLCKSNFSLKLCCNHKAQVLKNFLGARHCGRLWAREAGYNVSPVSRCSSRTQRQECVLGVQRPARLPEQAQGAAGSHGSSASPSPWLKRASLDWWCPG